MKTRETLSRAAMRLGLGRRESLAAVESFLGSIVKALHEGRTVSLVGFGSWEWVEKPARKAHHPRTMRAITLPERRKLVFRPSEVLKRKLNKGKR